MTKTASTRSSITDEFQHLPINDQRLVHRIITTAQLLEDQPEKSIPEACISWANTKAAYQMFANPKITPEAILACHRENTIERIKHYPIVLLIQDTSEFNFDTHQHTQGLGPRSSSNPIALGLFMHSVLAVTVSGIPLGLLYQDIWARDPQRTGKTFQRRRLPIESKESFKWLKALEESAAIVPEHIKTVMVGDREADIAELFQKAIAGGHHLLVRAAHNRRITEEHQLLKAQLQSMPITGTCIVPIPRKPERKLPPRDAKLMVRFGKVTICPAHTQTKQPTSGSLLAILAEEIETPAGEEPIRWMLLTTVPVLCLQDAIEKIEWYRERWKIERFHYVLKSGCKVEDLQLETAERLKNAIALYSIVAWRLSWITYQSRVTPDAPCSIILETHEWQMLYCVVKQTKTAPDVPPTLKEAVYLLARLGGFLGRKGDGEPGVKVLWRGLQKLNEGLLFVECFRSIQSSSEDMGNV
jgi:hypothetical protein